MPTGRILYTWIILLIASCNVNDQTYNFYGKWQSLNDASLVIEITKDQQYNMYQQGSLFPFDTPGQLQISIENRNENWFTFTIIDLADHQPFSKGRIEVVNQDRIRIYHHKHNNILDLADEYHRTSSFDSFEGIMDRLNPKKEKGSN